MNQALCAWLAAASRTGDAAVAAFEAAKVLADDPWAVVNVAGALSRSRLSEAPHDLGLTTRLRVVSPDAANAIAKVQQGAPFPQVDRLGRQGRGAWDTPRDLVEGLVDAAIASAKGPVRTALDPACGTGAFLVALAQRGVKQVHGIELDPRAAAVARVAVPRAQIKVADGLAPGPTVDVVVGNPPFISPERQDKTLRIELKQRFPWLRHRFDLSVPFAAAALERCRDKGGFGLVLPAPVMSQPYGRALRRRWLTGHRITHLRGPIPFPGALVEVICIGMEKGGTPGPLPDHGTPPAALLALEQSPLFPWFHPEDAELSERIRAVSLPMGDLAEIDTGVVCHGPLGGKRALLYDAPGPGRVPYVDAMDLHSGRSQWLSYRPDVMHRAKRPALFEPPKILVQRLRGRGPVHAWLDETQTFAGHTLTVVRPTSDRIAPKRLLSLLRSPLVAGLLRLERGDRLDLYPKDVRNIPVPKSWLKNLNEGLEQGWGIDQLDSDRLTSLAGVTT